MIFPSQMFNSKFILASVAVSFLSWSMVLGSITDERDLDTEVFELSEPWEQDVHFTNEDIATEDVDEGSTSSGT